MRSAGPLVGRYLKNSWFKCSNPSLRRTSHQPRSVPLRLLVLSNRHRYYSHIVVLIFRLQFNVGGPTMIGEGRLVNSRQSKISRSGRKISWFLVLRRLLLSYLLVAMSRAWCLLDLQGSVCCHYAALAVVGQCVNSSRKHLANCPTTEARPASCRERSKACARVRRGLHLQAW